MLIGFFFFLLLKLVIDVAVMIYDQGLRRAYLLDCKVLTMPILEYKRISKSDSEETEKLLVKNKLEKNPVLDLEMALELQRPSSAPEPRNR